MPKHPIYRQMDEKPEDYSQEDDGGLILIDLVLFRTFTAPFKKAVEKIMIEFSDLTCARLNHTEGNCN